MLDKKARYNNITAGLKLLIIGDKKQSIKKPILTA